MDSITINNDSTDEPFFENICNNVTTGMSLAHDTVLQVLKLNDELIEHKIPTSLQLHLTLTSSKLQRNFLAVKLQVEELLRLTKLYSVSWEKKNQSLKVLHKQYNSKQTRLNIALRKIEHLSTVNENLKRSRVQMNWEKMFLKLTQNQTIDTGWKQRIQLYKKRLSEGKSVADLFRNLDTPDTDSADGMNSYIDPGDNDNLSQSIDGFLSIDNSALDKFSDSSGNGVDDQLLHLKSPSEGKSVLDWVSQNESGHCNEHNVNGKLVNSGSGREKIDKCIQAFERDGVTTEVIKTDKDVQVEPSRTDKASTTSHIQYSSILRVKISRPKCLRKFEDLQCTLALNESVSKIKFSDSDGSYSEDSAEVPAGKFSDDEFQYQFSFPDDAIFESDEFKSGMLRVAFQSAENESMVAFCSQMLPELKLPITCLETFASENELTLLSTINTEEFKFNQPCGTFHIQCYISQQFVEPFMDRATQTLAITEFIKALEAERLIRCRSACIETEEKPVYTENDLDSLRNELNTKLEQLQADYEERINTLLLTHNSCLDSNNNNDKASMESTSPIGQFPTDNAMKHQSYSAGHAGKTQPLAKPFAKLKFSEQWGKGLPEGFLARLGMFNDASQRYHEGLKSKTKQNVDMQITRRLHAEKKLSKRQHNESVFSRDVYLPAIFMPIKSRHSTCRSARSYYNPSNVPMPQLSLLKLPKGVVNHSQDTK